MAKYRVSRKALKDLSNIWNYTYDSWSENQANNYYNELKQAFAEIADDPGVGKNFSDVDPNFYGFKKNRHIIFYRLHLIYGIEIVRILHEKMDISNRMQH
jgi:toxin ParE1/3/4